jgi:L-arabinose transport system ATP-binding protein
MTSPTAHLPALAFEGIRKGFPGILALDDVSFEVAQGSVHALLGENGAGKSTLLKILSGAYRPDAGRMVLYGSEVAFRSTADAIGAGVAVIYQELQLVNDLSVAENLLLGHLPSRFGTLRRGALLKEAARLLGWVGEDIDPRRRLGSLPIAQRQMVEIAKALSRDARLIAFDEPTSSLSSREVDRLFDVVRQLRADGRGVIYVSHRMDEIELLCDAATVLRDGQHVATYHDLRGVSRGELVRSMVGREIAVDRQERRATSPEVVLRVEDVSGPGVRKPVSLEVRAGEILGIFGLVGAGRTELLKLCCGATPRKGGRVLVGGRPVGRGGPGAALRQGMAYCPEDRKAEGIVPMASVSENVNLGVRSRFSAGGAILRPRRERQHAQEAVERLRVRAKSLGQPIGTLSGGNQQKAILGRVLGHDIRVLLLDEPTRGIDVGAKQEIYGIVRGLVEHGAAVVLVSSELPEVLALSDRVMVMRDGAIVGEFERDRATEESVLGLALPETVEG